MPNSPLITIGLDMPTDFQVIPHEAIHSRIVIYEAESGCFCADVRLFLAFEKGSSGFPSPYKSMRNLSLQSKTPDKLSGASRGCSCFWYFYWFAGI